MSANMLRDNLLRIKGLIGRAAGRRAARGPVDTEALFASHLPVLVGLSRLVTVRRVLELGAGHHSTPTFLHRSAFPDLTLLRSVEDDPSWAEKISAMVGEDPRVDLETVLAPISSAAAGLRLRDYDLVLVDDSTEYTERAETIRNVAKNCGDSTLVVIHDYEMEIYQDASAAFSNRFAFTALTPNTGVAWNGAPLEAGRLRDLNTLIERHSDHIKPYDLAGWVRVVDGHYRSR